MEPKKDRWEIAGSEREEFLRAAWRALVASEEAGIATPGSCRRDRDPGRLMFVDECGSNTSRPALFAWARRGERAYGKVPCNRGKNTTLLASMSLEGMGSCLTVRS